MAIVTVAVQAFVYGWVDDVPVMLVKMQCRLVYLD